MTDLFDLSAYVGGLDLSNTLDYSPGVIRGFELVGVWDDIDAAYPETVTWILAPKSLKVLTKRYRTIRRGRRSRRRYSRTQRAAARQRWPMRKEKP